MVPLRLAIVISHPIQYYSPWFRHLAAQPELELKVFYLWDFGVEARFDPEFGRTIQWDIPLLEGYNHLFIPNLSADPGTHHFRGLDNPGLVPALVAWNPDTILLFGYAFLSHMRLLCSRRLKKIPLILRGDSHDLSRPPGLRPRLARWGRSLLFRRFNGFLSVGKANADYYRHSHVPEDHIHFAPHCVDNARFQEAAPIAQEEAKAWRAELSIPAQALVVLFAGKFETKKRPMDLLDAFIKIHDSFPEGARSGPVLLFVGSGEWEERLRARSSDLTNRSVFFAPFQNQTQMPKVYATSDLLVLPSFGPGETWGLAVNEAMNLAKPVIVSSHVGCGPDLVHAGKTGWVFRAGDVDDLASKLTQALVGDGGSLVEMGQKARELVMAYSYEGALSGLLTALRRIPLALTIP